MVRDLGDEVMLGRALTLVARAEHHEVGFAATGRRLREAYTLFELTGDNRQMARIMLLMAYLSLEAGALEDAEHQAQRGPRAGRTARPRHRARDDDDRPRLGGHRSRRVRSRRAVA